MPPLLRRFLLFGFGVFLGLILVSFLFGERLSSCSYFPNARVKDEVSNKPWRYTDEFKLQLQKYNIDTTDLRTSFLQGKIQFSRSIPRKKPCGYYDMNIKRGLYQYILIFSKCENYVLMENINKL